MSTDSPGEIRKGRAKHGLKATMLSDRALDLTDRFGLRNRGVHTGIPGSSVKALPVPTSLLVDASGRVVWKDQSENYQRRSDPDVVRSALRRHFGEAA